MEFDIEDFNALRGYLNAHGYIKSGEPVALEKLEGGVSNRTVRVAWPDGHAWVLKQALAKLRVSADWFSSPERIAVEAKALRWLNEAAPPGTTPGFVLEDLAEHLMGMQAIPAPHQNWKSILLSGQIVSNHFEQFGLLLGTIHLKSSNDAKEVSRTFADTTYFENLRLEPYYLYTAQKMPVAAEFMGALAKETLHHKHSLVHGDFSPKNTLVCDDRLILLDYEVVHFGDPAFDVGFALTHFLSKAHHSPVARARLASAAELFWQVYRTEIDHQNWFSDLERRVVRHTLGCLLARVAGKSPLEYLTSEEVKRQRTVVLSMIEDRPTKVPDLITQFTNKIETYAEN
jgi:5-methylthioribose kinase